MEEILKLGKRLADYVRMTIDIGDLESDCPLGIAYRDFMEEWEANKRDMICDSCGTNLELTIWSCPKCFPEGKI